MGKEKFRRVTFLVIFDRLIVELKSRIAAYDVIYIHFKAILQCMTLDQTEIISAAKQLAIQYPRDLQHDVFPNKLKQFVAFVKAHNSSTYLSQAMLLHNTYEALQDTFPNVFIALRIYLPQMVSNCSEKR